MLGRGTRSSSTTTTSGRHTPRGRGIAWTEDKRGPRLGSQGFRIGEDKKPVVRKHRRGTRTRDLALPERGGIARRFGFRLSLFGPVRRMTRSSLSLPRALRSASRSSPSSPDQCRPQCPPHEVVRDRFETDGRRIRDEQLRASHSKSHPPCIAGCRDQRGRRISTDSCSHDVAIRLKRSELLHEGGT